MEKRERKIQVEETNMGIKKSQDYIYQVKNHHSKPKKHFVDKKNIIKKFFKKKISLLDVGCASGDLISYFDSINLIKDATGIDYSQRLISEAKNGNFKNPCTFLLKSAENFNLKKKFDVIIVSGVLCYFDTPSKSIKKISNHLKKNGIIIIFDKFNFFNIDILIKYRDNNLSTKFVPGWNIHSINKIKESCSKHGLEIQKLIKFKLNFELKKKKDAARSWIVNLNNKKKLTNGLNLIYDHHFLILKKTVKNKH